MSALLDVSGVTLRYKTSSVVVTATEKVSFSVDRSDRFVLLGPSGCCKSTLLKAVGGYMTPSEGKMRISGREITEPGADRMMIFQEFDQLLPWKTVLENVMFPLLMTRRLPRKAAEARARAYIEKVSLTRVVDAYPHTLSGGMKQRVAIARGMAMEPDILLMDEPFAALDALTRRTCQDELLQLWSETRFTVLFVTHSIAEAIKIGNRILLLSPHPGRVKAEIIDVDQVSSEDGSAARLEQQIHDLLFSNAEQEAEARAAARVQAARCPAARGDGRARLLRRMPRRRRTVLRRRPRRRGPPGRPPRVRGLAAPRPHRRAEAVRPQHHELPLDDLHALRARGRRPRPRDAGGAPPRSARAARADRRPPQARVPQ
jgi:NitT/TauT family transport system ATP-binding protein